MRWNRGNKTKPLYEYGSYRIIRKFLWFPMAGEMKRESGKVFLRDWRWLESSFVEQRFGQSGDGYLFDGWKNLFFIDDNDPDILLLSNLYKETGQKIFKVEYGNKKGVLDRKLDIKESELAEAEK